MKSFFTFLSLLILFAVNTRLFHFNQATIKITGTKIVLSLCPDLDSQQPAGTSFRIPSQVFRHTGYRCSNFHHYLHPLRDFIIACLVTSSCYIIYLVRRQQSVLVENEQLQAENIRNQYEVLKNQLNPHMLFNSLNTLRSLVRENQDKSTGLYSGTFRVLRYTLQDNESQSVTLREELEFASAYIFLLKMRYENNLQFDIQTDKALEEYRVPPMSIQMLIENAVKHNEISNRKPLTIHITTNKKEESFPSAMPSNRNGLRLRAQASAWSILLSAIDFYLNKIYKSRRMRNLPYVSPLLMKSNENSHYRR